MERPDRRRENAGIEEVARGTGRIQRDRIAAKGGFQTEEHSTGFEHEPSPIPTERLEGSPQFYRDNEGVAAPTHEQIARRAYELYIERGQAPGHEREDWLEAEKALSEEYSADRLAQRPD